MTARDEWILFLEKNPEFHELTKSSLYISIMDLLGKGSLNIDKIHSSFPRIESKDLDLIVDSLVKLKLVSRVRFGANIVYTLTSLGRKLLRIYRKAREGFKIE